jgi:peroxiredoxin
MRTPSCTQIKPFLASAGLLLGILCCPQASAAAPQPAPVSAAERQFRSQMALDDYKQVEYQDVNGKPIPFARFNQLLSEFPGFSMQKKRAEHRAVVRLDAKPDKSVPERIALQPGTAFPSFSLKATDGKPIDNRALQGRYALVSFYYAECAPCIAEVPMLNAFASKHRELATLAITFDTQEQAQRFARKTGLAWRTIANGSELIGKLGIKVYPTFALLDPKGMLIASGNPVQAGEGDRAQALVQWVAQSLKKAHGAAPR